MKKDDPRMGGRASIAGRLLLPLLLPLIASAQLPVAEIHAIHPPVIPAGETSEVTLRGTNLDDVEKLLFTVPGVVGEPVLLPESEFRKYPRQNGLKFRVTVPAETGPVVTEVFASGYFGMSTSRPLRIVSSETGLLPDSAGAAHHETGTAPELPRETLAHGTTDANRVDWWKFSARKGERLLVHCHAERIDSQADATLVLVNGKGVELERDRDTVGRDPMIDFTAAEDGDYWVGVHDVFFNGGANYPYTLQISERPWIDAVFPPAGKAGETGKFLLIGRNLPGASLGENLSVRGKTVGTLPVEIAVPAEPPAPGFRWELPDRARVASFPFRHAGSNEVPFGISEIPVKAVEEQDKLEPFSPPLEIASRFDAEGDEDAFRFLGKKGVDYRIEVLGDRLAGKVDPFLIVEKVNPEKDGSESFKKVRDGDDFSDQGGATFPDGSRDAALNFRADGDGEYRVTVINRFAGGGPDQVYRLVVREAEPDFEIVAVTERPYVEQRQAYPSVPALRKGGAFALHLLSRRKDGFKGDITVSAAGLPQGVTCPEVILSEKEPTGRIVFSADANAAPWSGFIELTARAAVEEGGEKIRPVRTGMLVWGSTDYSRFRLRPRLLSRVPLSVLPVEKAPARIEVADSFSVTIGEKLKIPIEVAKHEVKGDLLITPVGLRGMKRPPSAKIAEKDARGELTLDFKPVKNVFDAEVGRWTFVLKGTGVAKYQRNAGAVERANEEKKLTEDLAKKYTDAVAKARAEVAAKKKALDAAAVNLKTASPEAKAGLEKSLADTDREHQEAEKRAVALEAKRVAAEKEKAAAVRFAAAVAKANPARDTKFAAWSLPVTVEVKPAPEKEAAKK